MGEPAFRGAGKVEGLELWRIENLAPVKITPVNGKFYTGDSYILLSTSKKGSSFAWNIHFWLGAETSQDESGVAAYKSVELDDSLGGGPVQYREVQGSESDLFLSYFKSSGGIEYLPGGIDSGFAHVVRDVYETRLLHLKGKRTVRVKSVPVTTASLNTGDVFILDLGLNIYLFNGPLANKYEKVKGLEVANNIRNDERGGRANLIYLDDDPENSDFWTTLGGKITVTNPGEDDAVVEAEAVVEKKIFKLESSGFDSSNALPLTNGRLDKKVLETDSVYLIASNKLYIWIGKKASPADKKEAMNHATTYIKLANLPNSTVIQRVSEGVETSAFKGEFFMWDPPRSFKMAGLGNSRASVQVDVDYAELVAHKAKEDTPVDDGSGKIEIWRVEDFKLQPVPANTYGQFYGGDSYVMLYTYDKNGKPAYIIYFWQGRGSSIDEKGASALLTKEMDDKLGGKAAQIRVVQGKEPSHFRSLFKGSLIIHEGGRASGFHNSQESDTYDTDGIALFHVKGSTELNTHAVQVEEKATSLNSGDCFVLITPTTAYSWKGAGSTTAEQAVANNIRAILAKDYNGTSGRSEVSIEEHSEPPEFWEAIGGKAEYLEMSPGEEMPREARLFWASTATGCFRVEEIDNFEQDDLIDDDVMILDTYTQVFIWIGSQSTDEEKSKSREAAVKYIDAAGDGRSSATTPIMQIYSGEEPIIFTNHFHGWDFHLAEKNKFHDPYAEKLKQMNAEKEKESAPNLNETRRASLKHVSSPAPVAPQDAPPAPSPYQIPLRRVSLGGDGEAPSPAPRPPSVPRTSLTPPPAPSGSKPTKFPVPVASSVVTAGMVKTAASDAALSTTSSFQNPSETGAISYESLKGAFPSTVDPARKEEYLSDAEFQTLFGTTKDAFKALPKWKKDQKKKDLGLF